MKTFFARNPFQKKRGLPSQSGFTIIEIVVALTILSFVVLLVYDTFSLNNQVTSDTALRSTAAFLAQEGLEIVKSLKDANTIAIANGSSIAWNEGLTTSPCTIGCAADYTMENTDQLVPFDANMPLSLDRNGLYGYQAGGTATLYTRKIMITPKGNDSLLVDVIVSWNYNGNNTFEAKEYLYDR